jgi:hypothetical protein
MSPICCITIRSQFAQRSTIWAVDAVDQHAGHLDPAAGCRYAEQRATVRSRRG